ncbi:MAG: hypothetical protein CMN78_03640 [Spirochaetales bacterium]|nr:hypothetical protein [Spirochaetales bacterium]
MPRLVLSIIFLIILAIFIAFNAQYSTQLNLFGYKIENVSVVAVVILTLVVGVLYSFSLYVTSFFSKLRAEKIKSVKSKNVEREKVLQEQEQHLQDARTAVEQASTEPPPDSPDLSDAVSGAAKAKPAAKKQKKPRAKRQKQ